MFFFLVGDIASLHSGVACGLSYGVWRLEIARLTAATNLIGPLEHD